MMHEQFKWHDACPNASIEQANFINLAKFEQNPQFVLITSPRIFQFFTKPQIDQINQHIS